MLDLPKNIEAEQSFLGSLLLDARKVSKARGLVTPEMFYLDAHRAIYQAIVDLGEATDLTTVPDRLQQMNKLEAIGGCVYVASLPNATPTSENWEHYADIIRRTYLQRSIAVLGREVATLALDDPEQALARISAGARDTRRFISQRHRPIPIEDILPRVYDEMQRASQLPPGEVPGVPYGFPEIDKATGGQQPGEIILVTAPTGKGKSTLAGQMWLTAGQRRGPALMCSNEMTDVQYGQRLMAAKAHVDVAHLRNPSLLTETEDRRLSRAMGLLVEPRRRAFFQEGVSTPEHLRLGHRGRAGGDRTHRMGMR